MKMLKVCVFLFLCVLTPAYSYSVFTENGKMGLKNEEGKILIPPHYEGLGWSNGDVAIIDNVIGFRSGNFWGLVNLQNQKVTKHEFEELYPTQGGLIIAKKKTRTSVKSLIGCINASGKEVIPFQYDGITVASLRAVVFTKIGNEYRYGVIDLSNKTIIPQQYQDIRSLGTLRFAVKNFEDKIALFSEQGKQLSDFAIDSISNFQKDHAILFSGKNRGVIDRDGVIKVPVKYRDIRINEDGSFDVKQADRWSFYDSQNKLVNQCNADSIKILAQNVYKIKLANTVQLVDAKFAPITNEVFSDVGQFTFGKAVFEKNGMKGVVALDGHVIVPASFTDVVINENVILTFQKNGKQTSAVLFDASGTKKSVRNYEDIKVVDGGVFITRNKTFFGLINHEGKELVPCVYDSILQIKDENLVVKFHGQYGVISFAEKWLVPPTTNKIRLLGQDRYLQYRNETTELKALNGNVIYFTTNEFKAGENYLLEKISTGDIWKIDFNGVIVDRQFHPEGGAEKVFEESEGYRIIKRNGRYGFVDSKGRLRIANRYEDVASFKEGFAAVKILGKWGFINQQDNITVQPVYESVSSFVNGQALVKQKGLYGLIDTRGKLILPVRYEKIETLESKKFLIKSGGLLGLADSAGNVLISPRFDYLFDTGKDYVIAAKGNKFGVIGYNGLSTVPMIYDSISYDPYQDLFIVLETTRWERVKL